MAKKKNKTPAKPNPVKRRRRRKNPTGLTQARVQELGTAALGGAAAGILTGFMETNKPAFLDMVPTEAIPAVAGVALAYFAQGPLAKAAASGMVAYGAGQLAARYAAGATLEAPTQAAIAAETAAVKALISTNPYHLPSGSTRTGAVHVGGMTFTVEE
jgi:hypothetical protein